MADPDNDGGDTEDEDEDEDAAFIDSFHVFSMRIGQRLWFTAFTVGIPTGLLVQRGPWMLLPLTLGFGVFFASGVFLRSPAPFEGGRHIDITSRSFQVRRGGVVLEQRPLTDFVDVTARWARTRYTSSRVTMHFEDGSTWRFGALGNQGELIRLVNTLRDDS